MLNGSILLHPPDSVQWILWITHEYAVTAAVCRFSCYPSRGEAIIGRLLTFSGYIYNRIILPGNIFGLILKNKMAATDVFQILSGNIFGLILKNKMAARSFVGPLEQREL